MPRHSKKPGQLKFCTCQQQHHTTKIPRGERFFFFPNLRRLSFSPLAPPPPPPNDRHHLMPHSGQLPSSLPPLALVHLKGAPPAHPRRNQLASPRSDNLFPLRRRRCPLIL
ncbi:hypothetical protein L484_009823 [Morus notabilis]|uniref:Uncharacterized protein n=1 Tax=Morus notabilis TaxID=981085 RepID=W9S4L7_9ROSA|nr:hypothetical protein L484_009823 [Morus notabilis]